MRLNELSVRPEGKGASLKSLIEDSSMLALLLVRVELVPFDEGPLRDKICWFNYTILWLFSSLSLS